ncbi:uncharacterized protein LOC109862256 [Pseudomyrmex gracilis]|uniref:uncharacterized protein LOC109862256 n=1 Tax=Pseudomyrmex gracilis TaxID=219809 RepID=UPI000995105B|nr:uncharacterized protein LOC109862256 [Pseudomyrmex gracilis]
MNVTCNYCSMSLATEQDLNIHTNMFHPFVRATCKLIVCEYCSFKFKSVENYVNHVHLCAWNTITAKMIEHAFFYKMKTLGQPLNSEVIPPTSLTTSNIERNSTEQNSCNPTAVHKVKELKKYNAVPLASLTNSNVEQNSTERNSSNSTKVRKLNEENNEVDFCTIV